MPTRPRRSRSFFAGHGLNKNVTSAEADALTARFAGNPANGSQLGYFLGANFLRQVVKDLDAGHFDGLRVLFGESAPEAGASAGNRELVAHPIKFKNTNTIEIMVVGEPYASIMTPATEPSTLGSPPL